MDILREALDLAKAQASARTMTEDEVVDYAKNIAQKLKVLERMDVTSSGTSLNRQAAAESIGEMEVTCLICGKKAKMLTRRHLAIHGVTPEEYLEKIGLPRGTSLICKFLQRERREKMQTMRLWERKKSNPPRHKPQAPWGLDTSEDGTTG